MAKKKAKKETKSAVHALFNQQQMTLTKAIADSKEDKPIVRLYLNVPLDTEQQAQLGIKRVVQDRKLDHKKVVFLKTEEMGLGDYFQLTINGLTVGDGSKKILVKTEQAELVNVKLHGSELRMSVAVPLENRDNFWPLKLDFEDQAVDVTMIPGPGQTDLPLDD